jgi:hypothetical protein
MRRIILTGNRNIKFVAENCTHFIFGNAAVVAGIFSPQRLDFVEVLWQIISQGVAVFEPSEF